MDNVTPATTASEPGSLHVSAPRVSETLEQRSPYSIKQSPPISRRLSAVDDHPSSSFVSLPTTPSNTSLEAINTTHSLSHADSHLSLRSSPLRDASAVPDVPAVNGSLGPQNSASSHNRKSSEPIKLVRRSLGWMRRSSKDLSFTTPQDHQSRQASTSSAELHSRYSWTRLKRSGATASSPDLHIPEEHPEGSSSNGSQTTTVGGDHASSVSESSTSPPHSDTDPTSFTQIESLAQKIASYERQRKTVEQLMRQRRLEEERMASIHAYEERLPDAQLIVPTEKPGPYVATTPSTRPLESVSCQPQPREFIRSGNSLTDGTQDSNRMSPKLLVDKRPDAALSNVVEEVLPKSTVHTDGAGTHPTRLSEESGETRDYLPQMTFNLSDRLDQKTKSVDGQETYQQISTRPKNPSSRKPVSNAAIPPSGDNPSLFADLHSILSALPSRSSIRSGPPSQHQSSALFQSPRVERDAESKSHPEVTPSERLSSPDSLLHLTEPVFTPVLTPPYPVHHVELSASPSVVHRPKERERPAAHIVYQRRKSHQNNDPSMYNTLPHEPYPIFNNNVDDSSSPVEAPTQRSPLGSMVRRHSSGPYDKSNGTKAQDGLGLGLLNIEPDFDPRTGLKFNSNEDLSLKATWMER